MVHRLRFSYCGNWVSAKANTQPPKCGTELAGSTEAATEASRGKRLSLAGCTFREPSTWLGFWV